MASLVSSIIGSGQQGEADANAAEIQKQILANLQNIQVPTIEEQQLKLELEKNVGQLSPEQEGTVKLEGNALNNISNDPRLVNAQMEALKSLQQQGTEGLSASDKAALQQTENQLTQQNNSENQGTLQQFAQRGQGGSGANLAAELANNQNSSNTANQRALQVAGQAQQNALQATAAAGNLGTSMENQQYGQKANAAQATNAINQFNAQNSQNVMGTNTQAANQAQAYNLGNAQNIANQNVGLQNQQQQYNKGLYQQQFEDQYKKATGAASAGQNLAAGLMTGGANTNKNTQAIGSAANGAIAQGATLFYDGGEVKGYDDGGTIEPTDSFAAKLKAFAAAGVPSQPTQPTQALQQSSPTANNDAIMGLISKLKPKGGNTTMPDGSVAGPSNNFGSQQLQMQQMGQELSTAAPSLMSKGGMAKPPKPGDVMSSFRMLSQGGSVKAKLSPGEEYLSPTEVEKVEQGKMKPKEAGIKVPGKAKVKGDSPKNDTVDASLAIGGLVIPRSIIGQKDDVIMDFIRAAKMHAKGGK